MSSSNDDKNEKNLIDDDESKDKLTDLGPKLCSKQAIRIKIIRGDPNDDASRNIQPKPRNSSSFAPSSMGDPSSSSSGDDFMSQRVQRFLSIVDIPPEQLFEANQSYGLLTRQQQQSPKQSTNAFTDLPPIRHHQQQANNTRINNKKASLLLDENNASGGGGSGKRKTSRNLTRRNSTMNNGLSQEAKARIIREIIENYDLDNYIEEFRRSNIVTEIKLEKKYIYPFFVARRK